MAAKDSADKKADKPISLHPMDPREALRRFMQADPKEYREQQKREEKKS